MTTTDLTTARRDVARKQPANAVTRRNSPNVIDGEARPTRSHLREAAKGLILLIFAALFFGVLLSMTTYYTA
jgi:hypothetical protein